MSDILQWLDVAREVGGYLEPVIRKSRLKSALLKRGKSQNEAKMYILSLEFMKSDYVKMILKVPEAAKLIPEDPGMQMMLPCVFDVILDNEYAGIWFKDWGKIERMRRSILDNDWVNMLKAK